MNILNKGYKMEEVRIETAENGTVVHTGNVRTGGGGCEMHVFNNPEELGQFIESWAKGNEKKATPAKRD